MATYASTRTSHRKDRLPGDFKPSLSANRCVIRGEDVMTAVDDISHYVRARLARAGCLHEVDDVLQDIRMAVWSGVTAGSYQARPGIRFGAWVQGIANHICAAHITKASAHYALPLFLTPEGDEPAFDRPQDVAPEPAEVVERDWAVNVLQLTKMCVGEEAWGSAMFLLLDDVDHLGGAVSLGAPRIDSPAYRRAREHLKLVRQMAITVTKTLALIDSEDGVNASASSCAANCLPTTLHCAIAARILVPQVRGSERKAALQDVAAIVNVTPRYVAVQTGRARALYLAAVKLLRMLAPGQFAPV
jgi:hypothetical protein